MEKVKDALRSRFKMKDLGQLKYYLGLQFFQGDDFMTINQTMYLKNVLKRFDMDQCKGRTSPCEVVRSNYVMDTEVDNDETSVTKYRWMVGSLVYAMTCTRPDLSFVVTKLSQHLSAPRNCDWVMLKHAFRYVKATIDYGLTYRKSDEGLSLCGFSDSDWGADIEDRRSVTGFCFALSPNGTAITWKSRKQQTVALSTCEAEYMALAATVQEALYLRQLLRDITGINPEQPISIQCDNQGSIDLASNPVKHSRAKHIDIRYHFIRTHLKNSDIVLTYVESAENVADIFTKPCSKHRLLKFKKALLGCV